MASPQDSTPTTGERILEEITWLKEHIQTISTVLTSLRESNESTAQERTDLQREILETKQLVLELQQKLADMKLSQPSISAPESNQPQPIPLDNVEDPEDHAINPAPTPAAKSKRRKI